MCITKNCRKPKYKGNYCHSCKKRRYKEKNPIRYAYNVLRNNAKRRNKDFQLSFEEFSKFCIKTNYLAGKGIFKESYHIDRIDENKGYIIDNIQILTNTQNIKKYLTYTYGPSGKPEYYKTIKYIENNNENEYPF